MSSLISLLSLIISTTSTAIALVMLFLTRQDMNRRERKDQEMFVAGAYQNFQLLHLSLLQDSEALAQLADDRNTEINEVKKDSIASLWINQALQLYQLQGGGYLSPEEWSRFKVDMEGLFSRKSIRARWEEVQKFYPEKFQKFIDVITS